MTNKTNAIEGKLVKSLEAKGLGSLTAECAEIGLDSFLDEGIAKDIPIIGFFVKGIKIGLNVRERIYVKKIYCFLAQVGQTTQEQRDEFVGKYCDDVKRFEEAVLLILEQADNMNKSVLIGKIFKACILGNISYQDALSLSSIVNKALWQDLKNMFQSNFTVETKMRLCNCGLLNLCLSTRIHYPPSGINISKIQEKKIDGIGYAQNEYFRKLMEISEL